MHISSKGLNLVKSFESCLKPTHDGRFTTYLCPAHVLTIGWGHTNDGGRAFQSGEVWTQEDCDQALSDDMIRFERAVLRHVRVPLTQYEFDAIVSFTFNCGEGNLAKSTLLRKLNAHDFEGAACEFRNWNRGGGRVLAGLTRRRAAEERLFRSGIHPTPEPAQEPMPQQVDPPEHDAGPWTGGYDNMPASTDPPAWMHPHSEPEADDAPEPKSTWRSKIAWLGKLLMGGGLVGGMSQGDGIGDALSRAVAQPMFWVFLMIAVAGGLVVFFYWHDHGKGSIR